MGAMNRSFPINFVGVIFFHNNDKWEKTLTDPQEIPYNQVQYICLEDKTAVAALKLIQEIYVPENTDETLTWRLKKKQMILSLHIPILHQQQWPLFLDYKEFGPKWKIFDQCPIEVYKKSSSIFQVTGWWLHSTKMDISINVRLKKLSHVLTE
jgi:hypothetical protein